MFGLFKKPEPEPLLLSWSKQYVKEGGQITDKQKAFGQKLIFYGATVLIQKDAENLNLKGIKSDVTIIELSLFFLYLVDYALHAKAAPERDALMPKFIGQFDKVFSIHLPDINPTEMINSRLNLYGEQTRLGRGSIMPSSVKLLHQLINSSNQYKGFQYYKSRSNFIIEHNPIYSLTITRLTSPYIQIVTPILELEINQVLNNTWQS